MKGNRLLATLLQVVAVQRLSYCVELNLLLLWALIHTCAPFPFGETPMPREYPPTPFTIRQALTFNDTTVSIADYRDGRTRLTVGFSSDDETRAAYTTDDAPREVEIEHGGRIDLTHDGRVLTAILDVASSQHPAEEVKFRDNGKTVRVTLGKAKRVVKHRVPAAPQVRLLRCAKRGCMIGVEATDLAR